MVEPKEVKKKPGRDQDEVLEPKGGVTTNRGLQLWSTLEGGMAGERGEASEGTAERSARIGRMQRSAMGAAGPRDADVAQKKE